MKKKNKLILWLFLALAGVALVSAAGFIIWGANPLGPGETALGALESDEEVTVKQERGWITLDPAEVPPQAGFIFYPGGRVDFRSYAPPLRIIAQQGYRVVLVSMPLSLAVLDPNAAQKVMEAYPEIQTWFIGGHSLGGAMAARFVYSNPGLPIQGLVLWASYPAEDNSLNDRELVVLSIYGTNDDVLNKENLAHSRMLLPSNTNFVSINGGNHAQCGDYGKQDGDGPATISAQEQWTMLAIETTRLLARVKTID